VSVPVSVCPTITRPPVGFSPEPSRCGEPQSAWPAMSPGLTGGDRNLWWLARCLMTLMQFYYLLSNVVVVM